MSHENNEITKLSDIEDGNKLRQLTELLPFLLDLEKHKNRLLDVTPPKSSRVSAKLED